MRYFFLILLLMAALAVIAVNKMGVLAGLLYFACAVFCGIFLFLLFCGIKENIEEEDKEEIEEWT